MNWYSAMLREIGGLSSLITAVEIVIFLCVLGWYYFKPIPDFSRRGIVGLGLLWVLFITSEYWILGPYSFVHINDEGEVVIPLYNYLANIHDGGRLAHGVAGDTDAYSMLIGSMTLLSPGVLLFKFLPIWAAIGIHKVFLTGTAVIGSYLLARRGGGGSRALSLAAALTYSIAHRYLTSGTLTNGALSYAIIPIIVYLFVFRLQKENYFYGVIFSSIIIAITISPTHTGLSLGTALIIAWMVSGASNYKRFLLAVAILLLAVAINWHEKLFAFIQVAPLSYRGSESDFGIGPIEFLHLSYKYFSSRSPEGLVIASVVLWQLWLHNQRKFALAVGMLLGSLLIGPLLNTFPWEYSPAPFLSGFDFYYATYSFPVLLILAVSWAPHHSQQSGARNRLKALFPVGLLFAIAIGQAASLKTFHLAQWLGMGGQSIYTNYSNLRHRDWEPNHLFRTVTIPYRMDPNTISSYGLESFDGLANVRFANKVRFWELAMPKSNRAIGTGYLYVTSQDIMDFLCCEIYDADQLLNFDALRVGNVEYVVSALPLAGKDLVQVSGPKNGTVPPRRSNSISRKVSGFINLLFESVDAYIYKISNSLPRAYAAQNIIVNSGVLKTTSDYDQIISQALKRSVVLSPDNYSRLKLSSTRLGKGKVNSVSLAYEGYDIYLEMQQGGVLVVNTPWVPFWRAYADGKPVKIAEANAIHSAIKIPAGAKKIELRYDRPFLRDVISDMY